MKRDMSKSAYEAKVRAYGFGPVEFLGYRKLPAPHDSVSVCELNGGDTYRGRLAYLLLALARQERKAKSKPSTPTAEV